MKSIVVAVALLALSMGAAQAFTYDGRSNLNPDGTARFTDPDDQLGDGSTKAKSKSGFNMQFSSGPTRSSNFAGPNLFVPSGNRAFNSPFQPQSNFGQSPFSPN
jgi:hypothetical protein